MKRVFLFISLFFLGLFIPFKVYAVGDVKIVSVEKSDGSESVVENEKASFDGLKVKFNVSFSKVNDFVKYKVTVKNNSNKDYELSDDAAGFNTGEFVKYEFSFNDGKVIKANSTKDMFITIKYVKEVEESSFVDGKFVEDKAMSISLLNDESVINPSTGRNMLLIGVFLVVSIISIGILVHHNTSNVMVLLALLLIPIGVFALDRINIEIESKVEIVERPAFRYVIRSAYADSIIREGEASFGSGMTFKDYIGSEYFRELKDQDMISLFNSFETRYDELFYVKNQYDECVSKIEKPSGLIPGGGSGTRSKVISDGQIAIDEDYQNYLNEMRKCYSDNVFEINSIDEVIHKNSEGYYMYISHRSPSGPTK